MCSNNIFKFSKNRLYDPRFDYYSYICFRYHRLFYHSLIQRGRKLWAFKFFIQLKYELKKREKVDPFWVFLTALTKITPTVLLFPRQMGSVTQYAPLFIGERKRYTFAVKWVIKLLRDKFGRLNIAQVAETLILAIYNKGLAIEKKLSYYEISTLNRHLIKLFK